MKLKSICTLIVLATAILSGCSSPIQPESLNGYWEIESVTLEDGTEKEYGINTVIDYIEVEGQTGKRTKLKPQLDGTFITMGSTEQFTVHSDVTYVLKYTTPYNTWSEEIVSVSKNKMRVKNSDNKVFTYKKFTPFSLKVE